MKVAVVGGDGAGKSSATRFLEEQLVKRGLSVHRVDKWDVIRADLFPEYRFMRDDLPTLRRCVSDMQPVTRTFFLFWTLHGTLQDHVTEGGDIVLLDGYWPKHAASEILYSNCADLVEASVAVMPPADLTVFLDVSPEVAYERRIADKETPLVPYECGLDPRLSRESFLVHQTRSREILARWSDARGWTKIDADREPGAVRQDLLAAIAGLSPLQLNAAKEDMANS